MHDIKIPKNSLFNTQRISHQICNSCFTTIIHNAAAKDIDTAIQNRTSTIVKTCHSCKDRIDSKHSMHVEKLP
jgi:hypothetical protein